MVVTLAIDPGDRHVGFAHDNHIDGVRAFESNNEFALEVLEALLKAWVRGSGELVEVVVEDFVLYPGQELKKLWNPMLTSELIGAIKVLCGQYGVPVIMQGASIKKPTRRQLRARGIRRVGVGPHARDAELHLRYRLLRRADD